MNAEDRRAATHLSRLGVNPAVYCRLAAWAREDGLTLREMVRYILSDYAPAQVDAATGCFQFGVEVGSDE